MKKIFFIIFHLFVACENGIENDEYLTNNSSKYWDYQIVEGEKSDCFQNYRCGFGFRLNADKTVDHYRYLKGKRIYSNLNGDVIYPHKWSLVKDDFTLGEKYKIIKLNQDTLIYERDNERNTFVQSRYR